MLWQYFGKLLETFELLFISASGHTVSVREKNMWVRKRECYCFKKNGCCIKIIKIRIRFVKEIFRLKLAMGGFTWKVTFL